MWVRGKDAAMRPNKARFQVSGAGAVASARGSLESLCFIDSVCKSEQLIPNNDGDVYIICGIKDNFR